jgi:hypothetical protein
MKFEEYIEKVIRVKPGQVLFVELDKMSESQRSNVEKQLHRVGNKLEICIITHSGEIKNIKVVEKDSIRILERE